MESKEDKALSKLLKAIGTIIISIVFAILAYFVLTRFADKLILSDIVDVSNGAIETISNLAKEKLNLELGFLQNQNFYFALQIYWIASFPFGYYLLTKIMGIGLITAIIKLVLSSFISPIIMPIALVVSIVNIVKAIPVLKEEY